jgi:hypothetical protein
MTFSNVPLNLSLKSNSVGNIAEVKMQTLGNTMYKT